MTFIAKRGDRKKSVSTTTSKRRSMVVFFGWDVWDTPIFGNIVLFFLNGLSFWMPYRWDVHENYSGAIRSCSIKHPNTPLEAPWGVLDFHVYTLRFLCAWVCWTTSCSGNKTQRRWKGRCGKPGENKGVGLHPGKIQHWKMGTLEKEVRKKVPYVFFQLFPLGLLEAYEFEASSFYQRPLMGMK